MSAYTISQAFPVPPPDFLMGAIEDYKWTVLLAFPPGSWLCAPQSGLEHIQGALLVSLWVPAPSLVGVLCRISRSKCEPVMLNACKEVCRRSPRCVDSHVFECLRCGGSGCGSVVQTPARVQPSGPGSSAQMELCAAGPTREEARSCWAEVKTKGCSRTVWQVQVHILTGRFLRAVLFRNHTGSVGLNPLLPRGLQLYPACPVPSDLGVSQWEVVPQADLIAGRAVG